MTIFEIYQRYQLTSGFGPRTYKDQNGNWVSDVHYGADFATPIGTPIHSHGDYRLKLSGLYSGEYILNMEALDGSHNWTIGHGSSCPLPVGSVVKAGDLVFYTGNSGNSTAPHDHTEYDQGKFKGSVTANHKAGTTVDPIPHIEAIGGTNVTWNEFVRQMYRGINPGGMPSDADVQKHADYLAGASQPDRDRWVAQFPEEQKTYITQFHALEYYDGARGGWDTQGFAERELAAGHDYQYIMNKDMPYYKQKEADAAHLAEVVATQESTIDVLEQENDENEVIIQELHEALDDCLNQGECDCKDQTGPTSTPPETDPATPPVATPGLLERLIDAITAWLNRN